MSLARCCDVCDGFYKDEEFDTKNEYVDGRPILNIDIHTWGMFRTLDLCPTCSDKLRNFLGRERTCLK